MVSRYSAYRRGDDTIPPDVIDRIFIGVCAVVWLALLGVSVAAVVALVDLGSGFHKVARSPHTTWVLYTVIIVSALIIAGAIPVLLRARRTAQIEPGVGSNTAPARAGRPAVRTASAMTRTAAERAQLQHVHGSSIEWNGAEADRIWLRGTVALAGALGAALIAVAAATYLMAVGHDGGSWIAYGLAGAFTAGMPALEFVHVRQLRRVIASQYSLR